jgi:hypothetical protein
MPAWLLLLLGGGAIYLYSKGTFGVPTPSFGTPLGASAINYVQQILATYTSYNMGNQSAAQAMTGAQGVMMTAQSDTSVPTVDDSAIAALVAIGTPMGSSAINYLNQILSLYTAYNNSQANLLTQVINFLTPAGSQTTPTAIQTLQQQVMQIWQVAKSDNTVSSTDLQSIAAIISH